MFRTPMVAVFVVGAFWLGWRFPIWRDELSEAWEVEIEASQRRDARNFRKFRRSGWTVIGFCERQVKRNLHDCIARVEFLLPCRPGWRRILRYGTNRPGQSFQNG
jgi:G:T-mismatch repair DNA endonuclease (very short patch repair protein)